MLDKESLPELAETYYDVADFLGVHYKADRQQLLRLADVIKDKDGRLFKIMARRSQAPLVGFAALARTIKLDFEAGSRGRTLHNLSVAAEIGAFAARDIFANLSRSNQAMSPPFAYGTRHIFDRLQSKMEEAMPAEVSHPAQVKAAAALARARELIDS